jgi:adenosylcobinamide-phosphate synthase
MKPAASAKSRPVMRAPGILTRSSRRANRKASFEAMYRDADRHVSPNAGWPEAALAGALAIRLGGRRSYGGREVDLATMGDGKDELDQVDIERGLSLYGRALTLLTVCVVAVALIS